MQDNNTKKYKNVKLFIESSQYYFILRGDYDIKYRSRNELGRKNNAIFYNFHEWVRVNMDCSNEYIR